MFDGDGWHDGDDGDGESDGAVAAAVGPVFVFCMHASLALVQCPETGT